MCMEVFVRDAAGKREKVEGHTLTGESVEGARSLARYNGLSARFFPGE